MLKENSGPPPSKNQLRISRREARHLVCDRQHRWQAPWSQPALLEPGETCWGPASPGQNRTHKGLRPQACDPLACGEREWEVGFVPNCSQQDPKSHQLPLRGAVKICQSINCNWNLKAKEKQGFLTLIEKKQSEVLKSPF